MKRKKIKTGFTGRFEKGNIPWNKGIKTGIKPKKIYDDGHIEWKEKEIGSERITKQGYTLIKVKEPNIWELKQRFLWKQKIQ